MKLVQKASRFLALAMLMAAVNACSAKVEGGDGSPGITPVTPAITQQDSKLAQDLRIATQATDEQANSVVIRQIKTDTAGYVFNFKASETADYQIMLTSETYTGCLNPETQVSYVWTTLDTDGNTTAFAPIAPETNFTIQAGQSYALVVSFQKLSGCAGMEYHFVVIKSTDAPAAHDGR